MIFTDGPTPVEYITQYRSYGYGYSPTLEHINTWFPGRTKIIFDGGANRGHYTEAYALQNPESTVYSFEPIEEPFLILKEKSKRFTNVKIHQLALSDVTGPGTMHLGETLSGAKVVDNGEIPVQLITGRDFCKEHGIDRINFMKLDIEGHEIKALNGFDLEKIDFIQVETAMNRHKSQMIPYQEIYDYFVKHNFWVFGLYDQIFEHVVGAFEGTLLFRHNAASIQYNNGAPIARRTDAVFINNDLVKLRDI